MIRIAALVCASLFVTSGAAAQIYVEGRIGASIIPATDSTLLVPGGAFLPVEQSFGAGASGGVAVGYAHAMGLRTELNLQIQGNDFAELALLGYLEPKTGEAISVSPMLDLLYDIRLGESPFVPYLGAGIGLLYTTVSPARVLLFQVDGDSTSFAWEVVGGLAWELSDRLAVTANYRYLGTAGRQGFRVFVPFNGSVFWLDTDLASHNITMGLRYSFGRQGGDEAGH